MNDSEKALVQIKSLIVEGKIRPGEPISERSLALQIGLGRTPVREAVKELARMDLLEVIPMSGTFLRRLSVDEIREIYEVRLALEGMAAFLVAKRTLPPELVALKTKLSGFVGREDAHSIDEMNRLGWDLHEAIIAATGNRRMLKTYATLTLPIATMRSLNPTSVEYAHKSLHEHLEILSAIESKDGALAQERIMKHLSGVLSDRVRLDHTQAFR